MTVKLKTVKNAKLLLKVMCYVVMLILQDITVIKPGARRPAHVWFLRIASVRVYACVCVFACVCVCPPPRLLITSGVMWCDIDPL